MSEQMERTQYQGIYQRRSDNRRNHRDGKIDVCFYYSIKIDGSKKWKKVGWKSEGYTVQIAREMRADHMQALRRGEPVPPHQMEIDEAAKGIMTFGQAWTLYAEKCLPALSRSEYEEARYQNHIAPYFAETRLDAIKALDLETFKQELAAKGLGAASVKLVLSNIRRVYNKMTEWELYDGRIPTAGIKMPKVDNARIRYLTPIEADLLLKALKIHSATWWQISYLSLYTGMRLGEVLSLTRSDLDLSAGVIHVRDAKGGTRMAQMNDSVKALFAEMPAGLQSDLIFPARGTTNKVTHSSKIFIKVVEGLGFNQGVTDPRQKVVFHTLRHTFASWLAISGVPLYTISSLMGHASLEMTKRYAHLCPDAKREAVGKLELMGGQSRFASESQPLVLTKRRSK